MAQHDMVLDNAPGVSFRADANNALAALFSNNSGASTPSVTVAYMWWADTSSGLLKQRNAANTAWISIGPLASTNLGLLPVAGGNMTGGINTARGTVTMHATAMDLFAQPNIIDGSGSAVTITGMVNAPQAGASRSLYPIAGTTITHGATFDVEGAASYTTSASDCLVFEAITTSTYKVWIDKDDGTPVAGSSSALSKLSSFTAVQASNILTLTINPNTQDFRNASLTSGVPQTVALAVAATLAIPVGATLGAPTAITCGSATMSGTTTLTLNSAPSAPVQSGAIIFQGGTRIGKVASPLGGSYVGGVGTGTLLLDSTATFTGQAIVIINPLWLIVGEMANGEVFVVNQAGAVRLDETGLINTTAITSGSTSASTIYSTTARTNQPYKIMGMVKIAEPTVGTYSLAPELVFSMGAVGLAMMLSTGIGQSYRTLTGTDRVLGQTYINNDCRTIKVKVANNGISLQFCALTITVGSLSYITGSSNGNTGASFIQDEFTVPPGITYFVTQTNGGSFALWAEL